MNFTKTTFACVLSLGLCLPAMADEYLFSHPEFRVELDGTFNCILDDGGVSTKPLSGQLRSLLSSGYTSEEQILDKLVSIEEEMSALVENPDRNSYWRLNSMKLQITHMIRSIASVKRVCETVRRTTVDSPVRPVGATNNQTPNVQYDTSSPTSSRRNTQARPNNFFQKVKGAPYYLKKLREPVEFRVNADEDRSLAIGEARDITFDVIYDDGFVERISPHYVKNKPLGFQSTTRSIRHGEDLDKHVICLQQATRGGIHREEFQYENMKTIVSFQYEAGEPGQYDRCDSVPQQMSTRMTSFWMETDHEGPVRVGEMVRMRIFANFDNGQSREVYPTHNAFLLSAHIDDHEGPFAGWARRSDVKMYTGRQGLYFCLRRFDASKDPNQQWTVRVGGEDVYSGYRYFYEPFQIDVDESSSDGRRYTECPLTLLEEVEF